MTTATATPNVSPADNAAVEATRAPNGKFLPAGVLKRVRDLMIDGHSRTIDFISQHTGITQISVAARLRELRTYGYVVTKNYLGDGVWEYKVAKQDQAEYRKRVALKSGPVLLAKAFCQGHPDSIGE